MPKKRNQRIRLFSQGGRKTIAHHILENPNLSPAKLAKKLKGKATPKSVRNIKSLLRTKGNFNISSIGHGGARRIPAPEIQQIRIILKENIDLPPAMILKMLGTGFSEKKQRILLRRIYQIKADMRRERREARQKK